MVRDGRVLSPKQLTSTLQWALQHAPAIQLQPYTLAVLVGAHPDLLKEIPELRNPALYSGEPNAPDLLLAGQLAADEPMHGPLATLRLEIRARGQRAGTWYPQSTLDAIKAMLEARSRP